MLSLFRRRLLGFCLFLYKAVARTGPIYSDAKGGCCSQKRRTGQSPMLTRVSGIGQTDFQEGEMTKRGTMPKKEARPITGGVTDVFFQQALLLVNALHHAAFPTGAVQTPARSFPLTRIGSNARLFLLRGTSPDQPVQSMHQDRWHRRDTTQCPR